MEEADSQERTWLKEIQVQLVCKKSSQLCYNKRNAVYAYVYIYNVYPSSSTMVSAYEQTHLPQVQKVK